MIRIDSINLTNIDASKLPPARRDGPARCLFLSVTFLGFRNYHETLKNYAAHRDDLDCTFIELQRPAWVAVLGKSVPHSRGWDQHPYRYLKMFRCILTRWLRGPLPIERFDWIHVLTQGFAESVLDFRESSTRWAVNLDATAAQASGTYGYSATAMRPMVAAEQRIYEAADLVVCRNRWCSKSLREDHGLPDSKIAICRNSLHPPPGHRALYQRGAPDQKVRLVFVGNDFSRKGGNELVRLHQSYFRGKAELHIYSRRAKPISGLQDVYFHGFASRDSLLSEILPTMDVFVMPTSNDMHPWALLEAASVGLPIVSTAFAGIPEIVRHGSTGLLCAPGDWRAVHRSLSILIEDPDLRWRMGAAAREHVRNNYDPDVAFNGLLDRFVEPETPQGPSRPVDA